MFQLVHDIRFAFRRFRRVPGPFLAAIVLLTLGIGANTAIFSLVDGIALRPLPIADPSHLVGLQSVKSHAAADSESSNTTSGFEEFEDLRQQVPAFAGVAAVDRRGVALESPEGLQLLMAEVVSDNYFPFMGVQPELGRLPDENELNRLHAPVLILSHATWKRLFNANPGVVGQTIKLRTGSATILAVMPAGFRGTERIIDPQVYVPRSTWTMWNPDELKAGRKFREYEIYARLRPGVTLDQVKAQLQTLGADLQVKYPQSNNGRTFTAGWQAEMEGGMKTLSLLVLAIAGCVLLIACANVANLLLAVNDARRKEIAMRAALGAGRGQLLRQLITEYAALAAVGVAGALGLAEWVIALVPALMPNIGYPLGFDFRMDHRVLLFAICAGVLSVLVCGLIPSISMTRTSPLDAMRAQTVPGGRFKMPARKIFVVAQLAVSMALLMATGLLVRSLVHIETMNMGFDTRQSSALMGLHIAQDGPRLQAEYDALVARMKALPGAKDATVARVVPFPDSLGGATKVVLAPGELPSETAGTTVWFNSVDDAYFRVMGVSLLRGRPFGTEDSAASQPVVILNQTLSKKLFGAVDVVGRYVRIGQQKPVDVEIVGVAYDGKYADVTETPQPYLYLPLAQDLQNEVTLIVTAKGDPASLLPAVRGALREVDANTMLLTSQTLTDHMRFATYANRMAAWLSASLGALALLLTAVGLYGVTAYTVSRRTHEIGIRMALGALRGTVFASVLKDGMKLALAGILLGAGLALLLGRGMSSLIYGVKPMDPLTLLGVAIVVTATSVVALIAPARRALRVNPVEALREE